MRRARNERSAVAVFCDFWQRQAREDITSPQLSSSFSFRRFSTAQPSCITLALQDIPVTKYYYAVVVLALETVQCTSVFYTCSLCLHQLTASLIVPCSTVDQTVDIVLSACHSKLCQCWYFNPFCC